MDYVIYFMDSLQTQFMIRTYKFGLALTLRYLLKLNLTQTC